MNNSIELTREEKIKRAKEYALQAQTDPVIYIDRFLYTFNPNVAPYHFPFRLFPYEKDLVLSVKYAIEHGEDIFIEKCREMGVTYTVLDVLLWFWRYVEGSNFLLGSRKEQFVDNRGKMDKEGKSNKEESLFGKLDYTLDRCPSLVLPKGFDIKKHLTYMSLINPENGNVISGESSNRNFSRGGRYKATLMDELAFWDQDSEAWGSTADTTRCRIVITTPGIRPSKAKRLRFGTDGEKIKVITLPYHLDPRKDQKWLLGEMERRSPEDFAREIMINWDKAIGGVIYGKEFDPDIHYHYFDHVKDEYGDYYLGQDFAVRGWTACLLGWMKSDGVLYIIDEYKEADKTAKVHAKQIKDKFYDHASLEKWNTDYGDPAGFAKNQQGLRNGLEMTWSIADEYIEEGFPLIEANNEVTAGINFVRELFLKKKIIIHPRCVKLKEELLEYRWKDLPENKREEMDEPEKVRKINDHLVDALRYLCYSKPTTPQEQEKPRTTTFPIVFPLKIDEPEENSNKITPVEFPSLMDY